MLYNNYEEYMRNVLGHSYTPGNTYEKFDNCYYNYINRNTPYNYSYNDLSNAEQMYPSLYKLINPMVCEMCDRNNQPITEDLVEQMTNHIYDNVVNRVEIQNIINLNIETRDISESKETKDIKEKEAGIYKNDCATCSRLNKNAENRSPVQTSRPRRNRLLKDLIRILILNELLRPNRPPFRPGPSPMPPRPPRPWY